MLLGVDIAVNEPVEVTVTVRVALRVPVGVIMNVELLV